MAKKWVEHGQKRRLGDLKAHPKNSREHTDQQIDQIAAAMTEWDWTNPILIDEKDTILAGHGRQLAGLKKWGADFEAPVSIAHGWSDKQKRAYVIADNQLTINAGWNTVVLQAELKELQAGNFDLKPMGFTKLQAAAILEPKAAAKGSRVPNAVISYTLVFDNVEQQQRWFDFVRKLKAQYQDKPTLAGKLHEFIAEFLQ